MKPVKLVVVCAVIKIVRGKILIVTGKRHVLHLDYDPVYNNTWEFVGELVNPDETFAEAAIRGVREETGSPDLEVLILNAQILSTRPEDEIWGAPAYFVQQLVGPQPWAGPCFVAKVPADFEPKLDAAGEVSGHRWWTASELEQALKQTPADFMGLHYPFMLHLCRQIRQGLIG